MALNMAGLFEALGTILDNKEGAGSKLLDGAETMLSLKVVDLSSVSKGKLPPNANETAMKAIQALRRGIVSSPQNLDSSSGATLSDHDRRS